MKSAEVVLVKRLAKNRWICGMLDPLDTNLVEFDFSNDPQLSLTNALNALEEFEQNVGNSAVANRRWSRIAELHVQCGPNWCNPLQIKQTENGVSFSDPVYVRIIPSTLVEDQAICIKDWPSVFPMLLSALEWNNTLSSWLNRVGDEIQLQCDLDDLDKEIRRLQ